MPPRTGDRNIPRQKAGTGAASHDRPAMISRYSHGVTGERQAHIPGGARRSALGFGSRGIDQEIDENLTNASLIPVVRGAVLHAGHA
jgi:hypothetical protein